MRAMIVHKLVNTHNVTAVIPLIHKIVVARRTLVDKHYVNIFRMRTIVQIALEAFPTSVTIVIVVYLLNMALQNV